MISIVILNWNGKHFLQQFLPSVKASLVSDAEIIIADNASTDDSVQWLKAQHPDLRIISLPQNYGFAKGYNEALKQVDSEYYVLLNSDVEVPRGWIEPVWQLMKNDPSIAACQPKILMESNRQLFEYAGAAGGWMDKFGYPFARGRVFDLCEADTGQYNDNSYIFWASGCAMFVRAQAYWQCGGLDEYFFAHMEEIDLCWRMQLAGYRIAVCPASRVYHVGGGTLPKGNSRKVFLNFRNNLLMLYKNMRLSELAWKLPVRLLLDVLAATRMLLAGDSGYFSAVAKAHWAFAGAVIGRRVSRTPGPVISSKRAGWYKGSVVWAYYVRKRKKFSEITAHKPV